MADLWRFPFGTQPNGALMVVRRGTLVQLMEMLELHALEFSDDGACIHIRGEDTPQVGVLTSLHSNEPIKVRVPVEGRIITVYDKGDQVARWFSNLLGYGPEAGIRLVSLPVNAL